MKKLWIWFVSGVIAIVVAGPVHAIVVADANGPYTANEGESITLDASGSVFATSYIWDFDGDGVFDDAAGVAPTYVGLDDGLFGVELEVSDGMDTDRTNATIIINNVAPLVDAGPDGIVVSGDTLMSSGSFFDPGADSWMATIDFGDGSAIAPLLIKPDLSFDFNHVYAGLPGDVFVGRIRVTDDDGGEGVDLFTVALRAAVPEPGSLTLMVLGLVALCGLRKRRAHG